MSQKIAASAQSAHSLIFKLRPGRTSPARPVHRHTDAGERDAGLHLTDERMPPAAFCAFSLFRHRIHHNAAAAQCLYPLMAPTVKPPDDALLQQHIDDERRSARQYGKRSHQAAAHTRLGGQRRKGVCLSETVRQRSFIIKDVFISAVYPACFAGQSFARSCGSGARGNARLYFDPSWTFFRCRV